MLSHAPNLSIGWAQTFGDVPTDYWAFSFIETFAASGITACCGNGNYCPEDVVTRAQMAVFLVRTFGLQSARSAALERRVQFEEQLFPVLGSILRDTVVVSVSRS